VSYVDPLNDGALPTAGSVIGHQQADDEIRDVKTEEQQTTAETTRAEAAEAGSLKAGNNLSDLASQSSARANLGLGSAAVQPTTAFDAAGAATGAVATETSRATAAEAAAAQKTNNLSDLSNFATARSNLGLGSAAVQPATAFDAAGTATSVVGTETARAQAAEALAPLKTNNGSDFADAGSTRGNLHITSLTPAAAVAVTNISSLSGLITIDGYALAPGDIVLLTAQSSASQNGSWTAATGSWTRPTEMAVGLVVKGRTCRVLNGSAYGGTDWTLIAPTAGITVNTTAQTWSNTFDGRYPLLTSVNFGPIFLSNPGVPASSVGYTGDNSLDPATGRFSTKGSTTWSYTQTLAFAGNTIYMANVGADPTGAVDCTALFNAAVASLPIVNGATAGEIVFGPGTFRMGAVATVNQGPQVHVRGAGRFATYINYYGSGSCFRLFNPSDPRVSTVGSGGWTSIVQWGGGWRNLTIDGTNAAAGAVGIQFGDNESTKIDDVAIQHFNLTGSIGLSLNNTIWWTEKTQAKVQLVDNTTNVQTGVSATSVAQGLLGTAIASGATVTQIPFSVATPYAWAAGTITLFPIGGGTSQNFTTTGCAVGATYLPVTSTTAAASFSATTTGIAFPVGISFGYNDLEFEVFANPGQDSVSISSGSNLYNGRLSVRGNSQPASSAAGMYRPGTSSPSAFLRVGGTTPNGTSGSIITNQFLMFQAEVANSGGGTLPYSIYFGATGGTNSILNCFGTMSFGVSQGFRSCNLNIANNFGVFTFFGPITGDPNLNAGTGLTIAGSLTRQQGQVVVAGATVTPKVGYADFFDFGVLTQNVTISLTNGGVGPCSKTFRITQAASGGPYTITWPRTAVASATVASPRVNFIGGTVPVMSTGASAVDIYDLSTFDGIEWYCTAKQAMN
jgi:hypothetical protein